MTVGVPDVLKDGKSLLVSVLLLEDGLAENPTETEMPDNTRMAFANTWDDERRQLTLDSTEKFSHHRLLCTTLLGLLNDQTLGKSVPNRDWSSSHYHTWEDVLKNELKDSARFVFIEDIRTEFVVIDEGIVNRNVHETYTNGAHEFGLELEPVALVAAQI
ncbi:hypothetical protein F4780DRAFT_776090 [Xylariomycetidae sp. FL0641]|nr:hypothetical protein F4780DRAFT_776090 [Xylariomycetidae sp. FL0641]